MRRYLGVGLILLAFASSVMADEHYIEVWNPPEARGVRQHPGSSHKRSTHRHAPAHPIRYRTHTRTVPLPQTTAGCCKAVDGSKMAEPDWTDIPRQITPEGNILRVDSRRADVQIAR